MVVKLYNLPSAMITAETINKMHQLIKKAKTDFKFIKLVTELVKECPSKDALCEVNTLYDKLKRLLTYRKDPHQVEMVKSVWRIMETKTGDCDDMSVIMSAAAGVLGHPYQLITIKADMVRSEDWSHVYPKILVNGQWLGADLTVSQATLGWEPPDFYESKIWKEPIY